MNTSFYIPQALDAPMTCMIWTVDECLSFLVPFVILFFLANAPLIAVLMGSAAVLGLRRLKGEQGHYFLTQCLYWYLPPVVGYRGIPPSYQRFWIG
jgi:type IV conjugative transfer system protein TraL